MGQPVEEGQAQQRDLFLGKTGHRLLDTCRAFAASQRLVRTCRCGRRQGGILAVQVRLVRAPGRVDAPVAGDAENPGRGRRLAAIEQGSLAPDGQHDFLGQFLGEAVAGIETEQIGLHARRVEGEKPGEGIAVLARRGLHEAVEFVPVYRGRS